MKKFRDIFILLLFFILSSCSETSINKYVTENTYPEIFPDYKNVTVPYKIAPLNFYLRQPGDKSLLCVDGKEQKLKISSENGKFILPSRKWKNLLEKNKGGKIKLSIFIKKGETWKKYKPFFITIASDPIDQYLVYRLIEPGYELWNKMGIYQRNIYNYKESAIYENKMTENNCVNCHSFCMQNPHKMMFHLRSQYGGTILIQKDKIEKLNTKTKQTMSSLVYPYWHPSGKYIAFSVNKIKQDFYLNHKNRAEVFDSRSNVVVYDIAKHEIFTSPLLISDKKLETFPGFSADGKTLYFCSAKSFPVPEKSDSVKYNLCSISFDPNTRTFGEKVNTLYNAKIMDGSASFPRMSPDGKFLLFTVSAYGTFPIWHKEADLYMLDLKTNKYVNMDIINSDDVDSYHSWSSDSRWIVLSSRRGDGLYTRLYIAYIGKDGKTGKAFLLPQKDPAFYDDFMKSYNIPEMVKGKVDVDSYLIARKAMGTNGNAVTFNLKRDTVLKINK